MKSAIAIITCLTCLMTSVAHPVTGKNPAGRFGIGASLAHDMRSPSLEIQFGYGFHSKWSVNGSIGIDLGYIKRHKSKEETDHEKMSEDHIQSTQDTGKLYKDVSVHFRYWTGGTYRGLYFSLGGILPGSMHPDCALELGYMISLYKGLSLELALQTTVFKRDNKIRTGLYYTF